MSGAGETIAHGVADETEKMAVDFLQRRRFWTWTEEDQNSLDAWLGQSVLNRVAYLRLEAGMDRLDKLAPLLPPIPHAAEEARVWMRLMKPLMLTAASLLLVGVMGFAAAKYFLAQPADRTFSTDVGGRALLNFADGTRMQLNTDTSVRFRMTDEERTVWLEKGEAWFSVSHDASRPFRVIAGDHSVTDLGTEFFVRREPDRLEVALLEGRAQLGTAGGQFKSAVLAPGDEVTATGASYVMTKKTPAELADELSWQRGVLVFRNTKLADAVAAFNRYNRTKLVIADPAIAQLKIGGEFKTDNLNDFLRLAQMVLRLKIGRDGNDIVLSRASAHAGSGGAP